jgi:hypothetical protein
MKHEINLTLDETNETYVGTIDGLPCTSDPDKIEIHFPKGRRSLSWKSSRLAGMNGDVRKALVYLWGVHHNALM